MVEHPPSGYVAGHPRERSDVTADRAVIEELMELLTDGADGFAAASEKLAASERPDLATNMVKYSAQRSDFRRELEALAGPFVEPETSGSTKAALHRAWMTVQDVVSGSDPDGVLEVARQGEEHAVAAYAAALDQPLSSSLRTVLERQRDQIEAAHIEMKILTRPSA